MGPEVPDLRSARPPDRDEVARLLAVIEIQNELAAEALDLDAIMGTVARAAADLTGANAGVVALAEQDEMVYRAASGTAAAHIGLRLRRDASLSGRCVSEGRVLRCDDAEVDPRVDREAARRVGAVSLLCVPLFGQDGRPIGALKVTAGRPRAFDESDAEILGRLAAAIAAHVRRAHDFERHALESRRDLLTDLGNRRAYEERMETEAARAARYDHPLSLVLLDLDGFKRVNDDAGHPAGDQVLRNVAQACRQIRTADDCYRIGGDEFAIVLPDTPAPGARIVARRITAAIAEHNLDTGVTATAGLAAFGDGSWHDLHRAADDQLIAAKRIVRDRART